MGGRAAPRSIGGNGPIAGSYWPIKEWSAGTLRTRPPDSLTRSATTAEAVPVKRHVLVSVPRPREGGAGVAEFPSAAVEATVVEPETRTVDGGTHRPQERIRPYSGWGGQATTRSGLSSVPRTSRSDGTMTDSLVRDGVAGPAPCGYGVRGHTPVGTRIRASGVRSVSERLAADLARVRDAHSESEPCSRRRDGAVF
jgi:hypothetical protein